MNTKKLFLLGTLVLALVLWISEGSTLEKKTHEYLNQKIAKMTINQGTINQFSLDSYLKNNLGFQKGAEELLSGYSEVLKKQTKQEVFMWMGEGGIKEDEPEQKWRQVIGKARNINHFHNPLGGPLLVNDGLDDTYVFHYTGQSSIRWAQHRNQDPGGKWSWHDARNQPSSRRGSPSAAGTP